jgi:hypothetical protein
LKAFTEDLSRKVHDGNYNWNLQDIPVTKRDFYRVAQRQYPILKEFSDRTISNDLRGFGVRFRPGTKKFKNNIVEQLYPTPKLT